MTEYEMIVNMLQRVDPKNSSWETDLTDHTITLLCDDGWYDKTFYFNEAGELVELD